MHALNTPQKAHIVHCVVATHVHEGRQVNMQYTRMCMSLCSHSLACEHKERKKKTAHP